MTAKELKRIFQKGECLSLDTLRLYNEGKLNKKSMHEVEKHLLECGLCSGAVDGLNSRRIAEVNKLSSHIQRRLSVYMNTPPRVSFFRRFGFAIISGAVVLSAGLTWWYLSEEHKKEKPVISDTTTTRRQQQTFIQPPTDNTSFPVAVSSTTVSHDNSDAALKEDNAANDIAQKPAAADQPGQAPATTALADVPAASSAPATGNAGAQDLNTPTGPTTRSAESSLPVRVKSVQIYPPVTHNDKSSRHESKEGQLGMSGKSDASFQLDEMPSFPGGNDALRSYIMNNFKPTAADRNKLTRYATGVMFVVNAKNGSISAPELSFSISPEIDKELMRVISAMPDWNPGKKRGDVDVMIGITFE